MEFSSLNMMFGSDSPTIPMVDKGPPQTEIIPFKIPMGIVDRVMNNRYAGNGTVHPGYHLLYIKDLCELFKILGVPEEVIMRKLFSLSLKEKALDWYRLLDNSHLMDLKELMSLLYSKFYPFLEIDQDGNYIYNFWPCDGESIAQALGKIEILHAQMPQSLEIILISLEKNGKSIMNLLRMFVKKTFLLITKYKFILLNLSYLLFTLKKHRFL